MNDMHESEPRPPRRVSWRRVGIKLALLSPLFIIWLIHLQAVQQWRAREYVRKPRLTDRIPESIRGWIVPYGYRNRGGFLPISYRGNILGRALNNHEEVHGALPASQAVLDAEEWPVSWRVRILPCVEAKDIFHQWKFDERWDSASNRATAKRYSWSISFLEDPPEPRDNALFVAVTGEETAWPANRGIQLKEITDPHSATILLIEYPASDIPWPEPRDLTLEQALDYLAQPDVAGSHTTHPRFPARRGDPFLHVVTADGACGRLRLGLPKETLRALFTIQGGETVGEDSVFVSLD